MPAPITAAVLVATYNRPDHLRSCLQHLAAQTIAPERVIVVDSSMDDRSASVAREHHATYVRNPLGRGHTATSRALGIAIAGDVDVIAFIDDDAYAEPDWLAQLLRRYEDPSVSGVGGRARNGEAGEEARGVDDIGRFLSDGTLTGNFAADPGHDVEVDHFLGANMSLRLSVVNDLGGIQDFYPGTCLREETEIALRMRRAGHRLVYTPDAIVEHVAGAYAKGRRFDARYSYYSQRNHVVLLARVVGRRDKRFRRYLRVAAAEFREQIAYAWRALWRRRVFGAESIVSGVGRGATKAVSVAAGALAGLVLVLCGRIPLATAEGSAALSRGASG